MFDIFYLGKKPGLFVHEQSAVSIEDACNRSRTRYCWIVNYLSDYTEWDWLWEPAPWQSHQRHAWASQWQQDAGTYLVPRLGYTETNYHAAPVIQRLPSTQNWTNTELVAEFDYSWHPDPLEPAYLHVFGTDYHDQGGPVYHVPDAHNHKYVPTTRAKLKVDLEHWRTLCNIDHFDYSWRPHPCDPPYIYVFGNQWHSATVMPTVEYHVPGAIERKYMNTPCATLPKNPNRYWYDVIPDCDWDYSWVPDPGDPPYIYVFGNQWWPAEKMPTIEYRVPGATERKYVTWPRVELTPSLEYWTVPDTLDVTDFDFSWRPDPGAPPYIYQFATQHQKTGGPVYTVPGATEVKYLSELRARTTRVATAVYEIDHLDGNAGHVPNTTRRVRYFDNYRDTLIRLAKSIGTDHEYVWVCSSICDYAEFDFSWHPEAWQATMLHVFASNEQKFGDTFFMHVPTFAACAESRALLDWYDINYVPDVSVPRRPMPVVRHAGDSHVDRVRTHTWTAPLTLFTVDTDLPIITTVNLWRDKTKTIVPLSPGATSVIVPQLAVPYVKTQLYDYPYINKNFYKLNQPSTQDIVFISYDEPEADENWKKLSQRFPRAQRVHGVKGMENALAEAARVSKTPWYFAVFGKTVLAPTFNFEFQPDYMQQPKHYIFYSENRANKLVYGEMAIIMYNCHLILDNHGKEFGLDYTMSFPHEVIPILSTYGNFDTSPYHAWRTAFRETAKLAYFESQQSTVEGSYRLDTWLRKANGEFADWVLKGSADGYTFFKQSQGDLTVLKQSFNWEWLKDRFKSIYGDIN